MNVLKKTLIFIFATLVLLVLVSFLLPSQIRVERSTTINAAPERIYEKVGTLKTWKEWTAWNPTKYPEMKWEYKGPESGVGAESMWTDPGGNGHMKITKADPQTGIEYDLTFDGIPTIPGSIKFDPEKEGTKVVWFFEDKVGWNPINRYFCNFFLDGMIGRDFETGLAGLKKAVEAEPAEAKPPVEAPAAENPAAEKPAEAAAPAKQE
jgi:uncharacterized protein YndB with AHSA1/START domain